MDDRSLRAVIELKDRKFDTVEDIRKLLGLLSFHRRHIQQYASISKPLSDLLMIENMDSNPNNIKTSTKGAVASNQKIIWKAEHQEALEKLINIVTNPPVLAYANFDATFFVHVDANGQGLGASMYQQLGDKIETIAYESRTLRPAEQRYHIAKLEFLAMKWAITH